MQRETKLGIALIGVLLTVFCGLLAKRLARPGRMTDADLPKPNVAAVNQPVETAPPPTKPTTLFAAKSDTNRPPEFDANLDTRASLPADNVGSDWQRSNEPRDFGSPRVHESPDAPPPLASPLPIADIGDRYATTPPVDATVMPVRESFNPISVEAPSETAAAEVSRHPLGNTTNSVAESPSVLPHRSAYAESQPPVDVASPVSVPVEIPSPPKKPTEDVAAAPAADPFLARSALAASTTTTAPEPAVRILPEPNRLAAAPIVEAANSPIADQWTARPNEPPVTIRPNEFAAQPTAGTTDSLPSYRNTASTTATQPPRTTAAFNSNNSSSFNKNTVGSSPTPVAARNYAPISATVEPISATPNSNALARKSNREGQEYVIQPNDSYWVISEKAYGSGAFFKALIEHNRKFHKLPDEMTVGQTLYIPDEASLRRAYPDLCPKPRPQVASTQQRLVSASARIRGGSGRVYTVLEGDTLFEIARHELGKPGRWAEIYDLNRDVLGTDFDYIRPGTELILPDDGRGETARQPAGLFPR